MFTMLTSSSSWEGSRYRKGSGNYWKDHLRSINEFTGITSHCMYSLIINIDS